MHTILSLLHPLDCTTYACSSPSVPSLHLDKREGADEQERGQGHLNLHVSQRMLILGVLVALRVLGGAWRVGANGSDCRAQHGVRGRGRSECRAGPEPEVRAGWKQAGACVTERPRAG